MPELLIGMISPPVASICLPAKGRFYSYVTAGFLKSFLLGRKDHCPLSETDTNLRFSETKGVDPGTAPHFF